MSKFKPMSTAKMKSGHDFPTDFGFGGGKGVTVRPHSRSKPYASGGAVHSDEAMDRRMIKSAVHKHEKGMHPGKPLTKLAYGGRANKGGC